MIAEYDKENVCANAKPSMRSMATIQKPTAEQVRTKSRFNDLLKDATNKIREESDNLLAVDQQVSEAIDLLGEWIQETNDLKLAQELAETLEKEHESQRRLEIVQGESAALRLAVEEKRRIKREAQEKAEREEADAALAQRLADEEKRSYDDAKRQLEEDEKLCKELHEDEDSPKKGDDKDNNDEDAAPQRKGFESDDDAMDYKADSKDDDAFDFVPNQMFSGTATTSYMEDEKADYKEYNEPDTSGDRALALSIARTEYRKEFQALKRHKLLSTYDHKLSSSDEKLIARLWDKANAEIDDVQGAVCITILLPNVKKLKVNIESDGVTVRVVAWRNVVDRRLATTDNSQYIAEFHLDGRNIHITPNDIHYEYSGENGILHVYIEEVCLDGNSPFSKNNAAMSNNDKKHGVMDTIKNNFLRIFNGSNKSFRK